MLYHHLTKFKYWKNLQTDKTFGKFEKDISDSFKEIRIVNKPQQQKLNKIGIISGFSLKIKSVTLQEIKFRFTDILRFNSGKQILLKT